MAADIISEAKQRISSLKLHNISENITMRSMFAAYRLFYPHKKRF